MAIKYGFFNSINGDRVYTADDIGRYLHGLISSGVYADRSDSLQVLANGNMTVTVQPGRAMLNGHYLENDAPLVLSLDPADTTSRTDAVLMRLDLAERTCSIYVATGIASAGQMSAPAPSLTRSDNVWEWQLAKISVMGRVSAITQGYITDTRADTEVCGWVTGLIKQVDTSTLFAQWEAAYKAQEAAYDAWLKNLPTGDKVNNLPVTVPAYAGRPVVVNSAGTGYELGDVPVPFTEDAEYPGCYSRTVGGVKEWLNPPRVWAAKDDTYCVYKAMRTAERWSDVSGVQKPVYEQRVDIFKLPSSMVTDYYAVPLPDGAKVIHFSAMLCDSVVGTQYFPVVDVRTDQPENPIAIVASASYTDGNVVICGNSIRYNKPTARAECVIKYVI